MSTAGPERPWPPERDPLLDAAWRAQSTELPPPSVDAAILAAAHREVASHPHAAGDDDTLAEAREPSRWWWGLAAAATIGAIAFGVVQLAPFGTAHDPTRATDMPSAASTARQADVPAPVIAEAPERTKPQSVSDARAGIARTDMPAREEAQAAPAREPALAAKARPASSPTAKQEDVAPPAIAPAPVTEPAAELMAKRASPMADSALPTAGASAEGRVAALRTPESFVLRIRELHEAGRLDEAARELVAFRKAYPDADAQLPPALRAWAATIQK
jgi:hypothetical protein